VSTQPTTLAPRYPGISHAACNGRVVYREHCILVCLYNYCPPSLTKSCLLCNCYSRDAVLLAYHTFGKNRTSDTNPMSQRDVYLLASVFIF